MNKSWVVSAPGKLILFGEHAVVLGKICLATAVNLRTFGKFTSYDLISSYNKQEIQVLQLDLKDLNSNVRWNLEQLESFDKILFQQNSFDSEKNLSEIVSLIDEHLCKNLNLEGPTLKACQVFLYLFFTLKGPTRSFDSGLHVVFKSSLPVGAGLGSSASYNVSLTSGLLHYFRIGALESANQTYSKEQLELINYWAFQAEKIMHGTPSGIDNTVSTFGKTVTMQKIPSLQIKHLEKTPTIPLLLTNTKHPRDTRTLVAKVKEFCDNNPERSRQILDEIHSIGLWCIDAFSQSKELNSQLITNLEDCIDRNHKLLCELGVGHITLDKVCKITFSYGFHTKLTGAGGGGCAITLLHPDTSPELISNLSSLLEKEGFQCFQVEIGGDGVKPNHLNEFPSI